jgi:hypothetical protein
MAEAAVIVVEEEDAHQWMAPLRAELEHAHHVSTRVVSADVFDVLSRYRKLQVRRGRGGDEDGVADLTLFAHDESHLHLVRDEEYVTRVWLHTDAGLLPACTHRHHKGAVNLRAPTAADVHAVARAFFCQEAFERELVRRLPAEYVAEIEPTSPGGAHVAVYRREKHESQKMMDEDDEDEPILECDVGSLAVTHLEVHCADEAHMNATAGLFADYAHDWTFDADGVLEIASLPMPTWRAALRVAALLSQATAAVDAEADDVSTI